MDIINDKKAANLTKAELDDLFERFARGKMQDQPVLISKVFAKHMIELFEKENLEPSDAQDKDKIEVRRIKEKFVDGTFDINLFNQLINAECEYRVWSKNYPDFFD